MRLSCGMYLSCLKLREDCDRINRQILIKIPLPQGSTISGMPLVPARLFGYGGGIFGRMYIYDRKSNEEGYYVQFF